MENLLGKFGRRIAFIAGIVAVIAVSVTLVVAFTIKSNVANAEREWEWNTLEDSYLTANVDSSKGVTFNQSFTYTFTFDTTTETAGDAEFKVLTPPVGLTVSPQTLDVNVVGGVLQDSTTEGDVKATRGKGTRNETTKRVTWEDTTTQGYIMSRPLSSIFNLPADNSEALRAMFPEDGFYQYQVICTTTSTDKLTVSQSVYYIDIWIQSATPTTAHLLGLLFYQRYNDETPHKAVYANKKNPTLDYAQSNVTYNEFTDAEATEKTIPIWEGFTFKNTYDAGNSKWYLQKNVFGEDAQSGQSFSFSLELDNTNFTATDSPLIGHIVDTGQATPAAIQAITLTPADGKQTAANITMKDNYCLYFDGVERTPTDPGTASTASTLPVGTTYTYTETGVTNYTPQATTVMDCGTTPASYITVNTQGESGADFTVAYSTVEGSQNLAAMIGSGEGNYSAVINEYDYNPLGFLVNSLPYVLFIGVPVIAFILWLMMRRRKYNNN